MHNINNDSDFPRFKTSHAETQQLFQHLIAAGGRGGFDPGIIKYCLDQGADITIRDEYLASNTTLIWFIANSCISETREFLDVLKEYYQDTPEMLINVLKLQDDRGKTALILAILKGWGHQDDNGGDADRPKMQIAVMALVEYGAEFDSADEHCMTKFINMKDMLGNTALHYAVLHRNIDAVTYLLNNGADPTLINNDGLTPAQMLLFDYNIAYAFINNAANPNTMLDGHTFAANFVPLRALLFRDQECVVGYSDEVCSIKVTALIKQLHIYFNQCQNSKIEKNDVQRIVGDHLLDPYQPGVQASLDNMIRIANEQNNYAPRKFVIRLFDAIYQFVLSLFGCDRRSVLNSACKEFMAALENTNAITPRFEQQTSERVDLINDEQVEANVPRREPVLGAALRV